jgi:hypothetical protein
MKGPFPAQGHGTRRAKEKALGNQGPGSNPKPPDGDILTQSAKKLRSLRAKK